MIAAPTAIALGLGLAAMAIAVWKGFASFSNGGQRSGAANNWQNENFTAAQKGPLSEQRAHDTAPAGYPGE